MRHNLIKEIKKLNDITNVIILTHNIDFIFLQSVVLNALNKIGHPKITIFADAHCAAETFANQYKLLDSLGVRYRVVPVPMDPGFRFHPKAVLLAGQEKAHLFIGSGNLTFGGWYENAEVWVRFDSDIDGTAQLSSFRLFLENIINLVILPDSVQDEITEAYDLSTKQWAVDMAEPTDLIYKAGLGETLFSQLVENVDVNSLSKIYVCTPFFDVKAEALKELVGALGDVQTTVLVQKRHSGLQRSAADSLPDNISLNTINFNHETEPGDTREAYIHAKFFAFDYGNNTTVFAGSANCSRAALTIPGTSGNAELLASQTMSSEDFQNKFLEEFEFIDDDAELSEDLKEPEEGPKEQGYLKMLAVRLEAGELYIGYKGSKNIQISRCLVNDIDVPFKVVKKGELVAGFEGLPKYVLLEAKSTKDAILSNLAWVDYEHELRSTARGRSLAHAIRTRVVNDYWSLGAWSDILDIFCQHIEYLPWAGAYKNFEGRKQNDVKPTVFSEEDVFSPNYGLRSLNSSASTPLKGGFSVDNFQQLLLRWFGYQTPTDDPEENGDDDNDDENPVDKPEPLPKPKFTKKIQKNYEKERKRAQKFVNKVAEKMSSRSYLENRQPELLSSDLKLISVLLLSGLRKDWLSLEDFFEITQLIWSKLFFTSEVNRSAGWFEVRHNSIDPPENFIDRLVSVELSAALAVWALTFPLDFTSPNKARFSMSCILSIARLPELWCGGTCDEIANELQRDSLQYVYFGGFDEASIEQFKKRWLVLIRLGYAIRRFEDAIGDLNPGKLRGILNPKSLNKGELLWQGSSGYCVLAQNLSSAQTCISKVYSLQSGSGLTEIQSDYVTPIRLLLNENIIPATEEFNEIHKKYIRALINTVGTKLIF